MIRLILALAILSSLLLMNCEPFIPTFPENSVVAMQPIYIQEIDYEIKKETRDSIYNVGKIFVYGSYLLINDITDGVHVIDNSDPSNPQKLYFINIPGNTDLSVQNNLVYVDNYTDLAVLRIDSQGFQELYRVEDVFLEEGESEYPSRSDVYFECPDPAKGKLIGWRSAIVQAPQCYKN